MLQPDKSFIMTFEIGSHNADFNRELFPNQLFNILQEAAVSHSETLGMGWDALHEMGLFWALSKLDVEIIRMPKWLEKIRIITWSKEHHLLTQPRDFLVETEDGELLVRATSNWALLDLEGKPHLIDEISTGLRHRLGCHAREQAATRLRKVTDGEWSEIRPVLYSHLDLNQHVNNTAYITWITDNFDYEFHQKHRLTFISINYLIQTRPGEHFHILQCESEPNHFNASIFEAESGAELCRIATTWKEV